MKYSKNVSKNMVQDENEHHGDWKTHPRMAYIPGLVLTSLFVTMCLFIKPAFSFEIVQDHVSVSNSYAASGSSKSIDHCKSLLGGTVQRDRAHAFSSRSALVRDERLAGHVAAFSLVAGVRFALSPSENMGEKMRPRLGFWQTGGEDFNNRSTVTITAYRQCQKEQALKALAQ